MKGVFTVIEGIDGSGKTTLIRNTAEFLENPLILREPSDLPGGLLIRKKLAAGEQLSSTEWLTLFLEDRYANYETNILPALKEGRIILQDRYFYSTAAYQGESLPDPHNKDHLTAERIIEIHKERGFPEPDLLIYMEIDADTAMKRISQNRKFRESFENPQHLKKILINYKKILPSGTLYLDGREDPRILAEKAAKAVKSLIKK